MELEQREKERGLVLDSWQVQPMIPEWKTEKLEPCNLEQPEHKKSLHQTALLRRGDNGGR